VGLLYMGYCMTLETYNLIESIRLLPIDRNNFLGEFELNEGDTIEFEGAFVDAEEVNIRSLYTDGTENEIDVAPLWVIEEIALNLAQPEMDKDALLEWEM
jgi:hypothetical protein